MSENLQLGTILSGLKNTYTVMTEGGDLYSCTLKGKRLDTPNKEHTPLICGDRVHFDGETLLIWDRVERKNVYGRWSEKRRLLQEIGANIDQIVCVSSTDSPPFLTKFIDRVLTRASFHKIPDVILVLNKCDLELSPDVKEHLNYYKALDYPIFKTISTGKPKGIKAVRKSLEGKTSLFIGASGVGKSSLLNELIPEANQHTSAISEKYARGRHTTTQAKLFRLNNTSWLIDTPGIKTLRLNDLTVQDLTHAFPEIEMLTPDCAFRMCQHKHEPQCAVKNALEREELNPYRYESFMDIVDSDLEKGTQWSKK